MGIRLYLTFYNCITASENAYATSSFGYSRDKFIHQSNYCWLPLMIIFRSDHITKQSKKKSFILWGEDSTIIERKPKLWNHQKEKLKSSH